MTMANSGTGNKIGITSNRTTSNKTNKIEQRKP